MKVGATTLAHLSHRWKGQALEKKKNMSYPSVAVVILSWNGKKFLEQFLPSVLKTTYANASFYVADNASADNSVEFLKKNFRLQFL